MSFRMFIYYCSLCGGWAALAGGELGRLVTPLPSTDAQAVVRMMVVGLGLGLFVGLGLGLVDALMNVSGGRVGVIALRALVVAGVASVSGMIGGAVGQLVKNSTGQELFLLFGWTLMGLLIGASIGAFDLLASLANPSNLGGAVRKVINGSIGGAAGGLLGGLLYVAIRIVLSKLLKTPAENLVSSSSWGFVALGACIGLLIGLAQVILKEAWLRVEAGFRPGREVILAKNEVTIGRAESCDIGLFGDNGIERTHARILRKGKLFLVIDEGTPGGTFLNDQRVTQPTPLRAGDEIRVGRSVIRFGERQKRN
jgi:hypothetical protein